MRAEIRNIDDQRVAGMLIEVDSEKGETDFPGYWTEFFKILSETGNLDNYRISYGYSKNYVESGGKTYLIAMGVEEYRVVPEGFTEDVIPGGRYAVYTYRGELNPQSVREFYDNIYCRWLKEDGLTPRRNECFEYYDSRFEEGSEGSEYDVWVPVL